MSRENIYIEQINEVFIYDLIDELRRLNIKRVSYSPSSGEKCFDLQRYNEFVLYVNQVLCELCDGIKVWGDKINNGDICISEKEKIENDIYKNKVKEFDRMISSIIYENTIKNSIHEYESE